MFRIQKVDVHELRLRGYACCLPFSAAVRCSVDDRMPDPPPSVFVAKENGVGRPHPFVALVLPTVAAVKRGKQ